MNRIRAMRRRNTAGSAESLEDAKKADQEAEERNAYRALLLAGFYGLLKGASKEDVTNFFNRLAAGLKSLPGMALAAGAAAFNTVSSAIVDAGIAVGKAGYRVLNAIYDYILKPTGNALYNALLALNIPKESIDAFISGLESLLSAGYNNVKWAGTQAAALGGKAASLLGKALLALAGLPQGALDKICASRGGSASPAATPVVGAAEAAAAAGAGLSPLMTPEAAAERLRGAAGRRNRRSTRRNQH